MTRTVEDTALMMSVLSQPDHRDGMSLPVQDIDWMNLAGDLQAASASACCSTPASAFRSSPR